MGKRLHSVWYVTRRVGVTARLRQIGGNQVTGSPQIATEMAGSTPPVLRTPMGTAAASCVRVRMEAWRQWRWSQPTEDNPRMEIQASGMARLGARMRRCLILRQGTRPLRPPAPFPSEFMFHSEDLTGMRERGPLERGSILPPAGRPRGDRRGDRKVS